MLDSRVELLVLGKSKNMKKKKNSPNPRVHHENKKVLWCHEVKESVIIFFSLYLVNMGLSLLDPIIYMTKLTAKLALSLKTSHTGIS